MLQKLSAVQAGHPLLVSPGDCSMKLAMLRNVIRKRATLHSKRASATRFYGVSTL